MDLFLAPSFPIFRLMEHFYFYSILKKVTCLFLRLSSHRSIRYTVFAIRYSLYGHGGSHKVARVSYFNILLAPSKWIPQTKKIWLFSYWPHPNWIGIRCTKIEQVRFPLYYTIRSYTVFPNSTLLCEPVLGNPIVRFKLFACPRKLAS